MYIRRQLTCTADTASGRKKIHVSEGLEILCKFSLRKGWVTFSLWGPQWVLNFDRGASAGADRWSVMVSHFIGGKQYHGICRKHELLCALKKKPLKFLTPY